MTDPDARDTLPAMHPDTPAWAESHYNLMVLVYQEFVGYRRHRDGEVLKLQARVASLEDRVTQLERSVTLLPPPMTADEDTTPGHRV